MIDKKINNVLFCHFFNELREYENFKYDFIVLSVFSSKFSIPYLSIALKNNNIEEAKIIDFKIYELEKALKLYSSLSTPYFLF